MRWLPGNRPFEGKTGFEIASSIIRDSPAPLPDRIPCGLRDIILRSLEKELGKRCNSAADIRAALEGFAARKIAGPSISARSIWPNWRRRLFMGGAVLVALFLVFILGSKRVGQRELVRNHSRVSTGAQASPNLQANEYFERAMLFLIPQFDLPRARNQLERSLKLDPNFAEARAWYGFSFVLEIDSGLSNDMSLLYRAEEELRLASRSAPRTAKIHSSLAALYLYQGRKELIPEEAKKALEIDPYELDANIWLANYYISNGDNSSAETLQNKLLAQNPLFFPARMNLADILRQKGRIADAIAELEKILEQSPQNIYAAQKLARTYIDTNDLRRARQILESLPFETQKGYEIKLTWVLLLALEGKKKEASQRLDDDVLKYSRIAFWSTSVAAECYALLGDSPKALEWLELAARNGDERDSWFRRDPLLANIRGLARFNQIVESIANRRLQRAKAGVQK